MFQQMRIAEYITGTTIHDNPAIPHQDKPIRRQDGFCLMLDQDDAFDRQHGLRSLPAAFGGRSALVFARLFHVGALVGFALFAAMAGGGWLRATAVLAAGVLLVWQHRLVAPGDLGAVDAAFFTANGTLSVLMCLLFVAARLSDG